MIEIWKPIKGHNMYLISNIGRLKALKRRNFFTKRGKPYSNVRKERILKGANCTGYLQINLDGDRVLIHRLVAGAFIPNPENKPQVNHLNCTKTDNRVENLEWVTNKENCEHASKNGRYNRSGTKISKLNDKLVYEIRLLYLCGAQVKDLANMYGVTKSNMSSVVNFKTWKHVVTVKISKPTK